MAWAKTKKKECKRNSMDKNSLKLNPVKFSTAPVQDNPDILKFSACVGYLDTPSDATPCGGQRGYQLILSSSDADVQSLVGQGVNVTWHESWFSNPNYSLKGHNPRFKVGVIDAAEMKGNEIWVDGHIWRHDFPDVCDTLESAKDSLGCSVEVNYNGIKRDDANKLMTISGCRFSGIAVLFKNKAAFKSTSFMCSILDDEGENELNEEQLKAKFEEQSKALDDKLAKFQQEQAAELKKVTDALAQFAEQKAPENNEPEEDAPAKDEPKAMDFAEMTKAIVDGVTEAIKAQAAPAPKAPEKNEPEGRKTQVDFSGIADPKLEGEEKKAMELSAEIDNDDNLTAEQKWAKQLALFNANREEFSK